MYWENKGPQNTESTLTQAVRRGRELGIRQYVVASNTGVTARKLLELGVSVVCVTHHTGYAKPGHQEMPAETREQLQEAGAKVLTTTHLMGGIDRAAEHRFGGSTPANLVTGALKIMGQGVKVCIEVAVMALDAGLITFGEDIVAVGGTGRGADTAVVIRPAHAKDFFDCEVREIICKPRNIK